MDKFVLKRKRVDEIIDDKIVVMEEMTMMDCALLERRREINRKAARKSRSRQKEMAHQIRKKYYEAQSANTKLIYERKRLVRERDELKTKLRDHRRSCPSCTTGSSKQYIDLLDEDPLPRAIQFQTKRSTSHKIPSSVVGTSLPLSRSFSCPESVANMSQLHWDENAEDKIELSSTSDEDDDYDGEEDAEEEEEAEEEEYDDPTNAVFSSDDFSLTALGIAEISRGARDTSDMSLIDDQPPLGLFHFEEQPDLLGIEEDPFSILDDLPSSPSAQIFGRIVSTDFPTFSKPSGGVDFAPMTSFDSSQSSSTATVRDLGDPSGTYYDDQQSEAIDLSKPRAMLPTIDPSSIKASTSVDSRKIEQKVPEPAEMQAFFGNIPLHVQNFIVGEK